MRMEWVGGVGADVGGECVGVNLGSVCVFLPDETEYEYSGSEEEDEERDIGEPRYNYYY